MQETDIDLWNKESCPAAGTSRKINVACTLSSRGRILLLVGNGDPFELYRRRDSLDKDCSSPQNTDISDFECKEVSPEVSYSWSTIVELPSLVDLNTDSTVRTWCVGGWCTNGDDSGVFSHSDLDGGSCLFETSPNGRVRYTPLKKDLDSAFPQCLEISCFGGSNKIHFSHLYKTVVLVAMGSDLTLPPDAGVEEAIATEDVLCPSMPASAANLSVGYPQLQSESVPKILRHTRGGETVAQFGPYDAAMGAMPIVASLTRTDSVPRSVDYTGFQTYFVQSLLLSLTDTAVNHPGVTGCGTAEAKASDGKWCLEVTFDNRRFLQSLLACKEDPNVADTLVPENLWLSGKTASRSTATVAQRLEGVLESSGNPHALQVGSFMPDHPDDHPTHWMHPVTVSADPDDWDTEIGRHFSCDPC